MYIVQYMYSSLEGARGVRRLQGLGESFKRAFCCGKIIVRGYKSFAYENIL